MDDTGFSNYHGLQVEFRQRQWHGMSLNANYTLSKTMGVATGGRLYGRLYPVHNTATPYPATRLLRTDRRHVVHVSGTYDLPFGSGQAVAERWNTREDRGWLDGLHDRHVPERHPVPDYGEQQHLQQPARRRPDSERHHPQDIQDRVGLYFDAAGLAYYLPPDWIAQVKADGTIASNNVPGTWGQIFYLHGPHQTFTDIGISKAVNITERVRFKFQTEMLNAFNHPTFCTGHHRLSGRDRVRPRQPDRHVAPHRVPGEHRILIRLQEPG